MIILKHWHTDPQVVLVSAVGETNAFVRMLVLVLMLMLMRVLPGRALVEIFHHAGRHLGTK